MTCCGDSTSLIVYNSCLYGQKNALSMPARFRDGNIRCKYTRSPALYWGMDRSDALRLLIFSCKRCTPDCTESRTADMRRTRSLNDNALEEVEASPRMMSDDVRGSRPWRAKYGVVPIVEW